MDATILDREVYSEADAPRSCASLRPRWSMAAGLTGRPANEMHASRVAVTPQQYRCPARVALDRPDVSYSATS